MQRAVDRATGALLGKPGGSVLAVVTLPGGAPPVANVPAWVYYTNATAPRQGRAGSRRCGAIVRLRRVELPERPSAGTTVVRSSHPGEVLTLQSIATEAAWWRGEATL